MKMVMCGSQRSDILPSVGSNYVNTCTCIYLCTILNTVLCCYIGLASPVYDAHPASDASNISPQGCGSGLDSVDKQCQLPGHYNTTPDSDSDGEVDNPCRILRMHNVIHNSDLLRWADGFSFGPGNSHKFTFT